VAVALGALALVGLAAAAVPLVTDSKREGEARERELERLRVLERRREVIAAQRPRYGRSASAGRAGLARSLDRAIVADVAQRVRRGEVDTVAERSDCETARLERTDGKTLLFCTAVTSDIKPGKYSTGAAVGYLYRALTDPRTGNFAFCKVVGQAGEGSYTRRPPPPISRDCGG